MALKLQQIPGDAEPQTPPEASMFTISADPVIADRVATSLAEPGAQGDDSLPQSYGVSALTLMPRDPHSLFAYWDIDWPATFKDGAPPDQKVHLRVLNAAGAEEAAVEVEPMARSCYVSVPHADASYSAELAYRHPSGVWKSVARSHAVQTPPDVLSDSTAVDFATVPFHLSFQRMIDVFRVSNQESGSLMAMLSDLRERVTPESESRTFTPEEREIARAIDEVLADAPPSSAQESSISDAAVQEHLDRILGIGRAGATSPTSGFSGSSHTFRS